MKRLPPLTWILIAGAIGVVVFAAYKFAQLREVRSLTGAILREDPDPDKQLPIDGVQVTIAGDLAKQSALSGASGLFRINLRKAMRRGQFVTLEFRQPGYQPLNILEELADRLYVIRMDPVETSQPPPPGPPVSITDLRVRYEVKMPNTTNIGTAVKTFTVTNKGNVPCKGQSPCSPEGKWKAAIGTASIDAGPGNVFEHARVTCIAGPCPFTRVERDTYSQDGRVVTARVRDWSDTATFVLEAEVMRSSVVDMVLQAFPVILSQAVSFTLPPSAQGPSIEATVNGQDIVYPLGPTLRLSWADCNMQPIPGGTSELYRCLVKPGYHVQ
jgi:hypothetical protein